MDHTNKQHTRQEDLSAVLKNMSPDPNAPWTGPAAKDMLATHTLAQEIINRHDDPCPVLGGSELELLRDYVMDASPAHALELLKDRGMIDEEGDRLGLRAQGKNSLIGYCIVRNLDVERRGDAAKGPGFGTALNSEEIDLLRDWFRKGAAEERIEGWKEGRKECE